MIIEIAQDREPVQPPASQRVGVLVHGNYDIQDHIAALRSQGVQQACVAYVMPTKRQRRRYALAMGLSQCHNCPCAVFEDRARAEAWLNRQLQ